MDANLQAALPSYFLLYVDWTIYFMHIHFLVYNYIQVD